MSRSAEPLSARPAIRTRSTQVAGGLNTAASPRSPRTPLLGRSISSQFGSPGTFRIEQEDVVIYELNPRFVSAGYAGESRPRCIIPFTPERNRRAGDYSHLIDKTHAYRTREFRLREDWASSYELYREDLRGQDLGLVEDKLERVVRTIHTDHLQMDSKARKAILVVPPLTPEPVLEVALRVLFGHFAQPPSISLLTTPVLCCASAGLRDALVLDIGWEETVATAVGEYKGIACRRSIRAGKMLTKEMAATIELAVSSPHCKLTCNEAEDLVQRVAWCRSSNQSDSIVGDAQSNIMLPLPSDEDSTLTFDFPLPFSQLADPAEMTFFAASDSGQQDHDDHDLPLHLLAYKVLLSLPVDLRSTCLHRIVVTGHCSRIPGLRRRLLCEITQLVQTRGWDVVNNYGSATVLRRKAKSSEQHQSDPVQASGSDSVDASDVTPAPGQLDTVGELTTPNSDPSAAPPPLRAADRSHDDIHDPVTIKAERRRKAGEHAGETQEPPNAVRGVESLGAWAGASMLSSLRVRGVQEVERDDFLKHGFRGSR